MMRVLHLLLLLIAVAALALTFAQVEIQIEGSAGWAANLPTWRVEKHWLLDLFWGGRAMTGYHAWVFPFMFLVFHLGFVLTQRWSRWLEARARAGVVLLWGLEALNLLVINHPIGIERFTPANVPWHRHWFLGAPVDYWVFGLLASALLWYSFVRAPRDVPASRTPVETPK